MNNNFVGVGGWDTLCEGGGQGLILVYCESLSATSPASSLLPFSVWGGWVPGSTAKEGGRERGVTQSQTYLQFSFLGRSAARAGGCVGHE